MNLPLRTVVPLAALLSALAPLSVSGQGAASAQQKNASRSSPAPSLAAMREHFRTPPPQARLRCYWWWLNGNTTEATITRDLTEMSRKGYAGALLVDANGSDQNGNALTPAGPTFGSPAWVKLYVHALQVAASLHLEITLNITSGWNLGGPDVQPADASKLLTWTQTVVDAKGFHGQLPAPAEKNGFYREIAVLAYPLAHGADLAGHGSDHRTPISDLAIKSAAVEMSFSMPHTEQLLTEPEPVPGEADAQLAQVMNLSTQTSADGRLDWTPPSPGAWEILRIGYTDSGARVSTASGTWQGLAIDYLDRHAFDTYWDHTVSPLLDAARPYLGSTLVSLATDSWELGGTNWTGRFAAEFRARRGYDLVPYLPIVAGRILGDGATSNRFLNDLRRTVGDLVTDHYDHFAERARARGVGMQCESGGPHGAPIDALETFRSSAVPQTEYWAESNEHRSRDEDRYFTKEAASAADIYGRTFAANEGMTTIGPQWSESLATDLKPSFDQALTEGLNRLVWHEFTSSPADNGLPGNEYFAGTHLDPNVTWWNQAGDFLLYLNRSQYLLQQGHSVDDALYFYGDEVPNFVRLKRDDPAHVLPGYDYDVTDEDALLRTLRIDHGALHTPAGNAYHVLVMPLGRRLSLVSLERIAAYVHDGGVLAGATPLGPTGLLNASSAQRFGTLLHDLWAACPAPHAYGAGKVFCTADARSTLTQLGLPPDFQTIPATLDYIHRATSATDIYFVRNGSGTAQDVVASFRVTGAVPELWSAVDGSIETPGGVGEAGGRTTMPLHLAPYGSIFVVFHHGAPGAGPSNARSTTSKFEQLPASQWTLSFQPGRGAPTTSQPLAAFDSWTKSTDPGVRYFSGTATYATDITSHAEPGQHVFLNLTELHEVASVRIDGRPVGTIWAIPYRLDITAALHSGSNHLEIDVTNLWPNRIIGDAQPNATRTYTKTNIRKYTADSPLLPSGLIGPVTLETSTPADR